MDQAIKEQWIAALERGEYEQGHGALCLLLPDGTKKWCCLGVLCDLAVKAGVEVGVKHLAVGSITFNTAHETRSYGSVSFGGENALLPEAVAAWAGLDSASPSVLYRSGPFPASPQSLAVLNDGGKTFAEIAQLIRESL